MWYNSDTPIPFLRSVLLSCCLYGQNSACKNISLKYLEHFNAQCYVIANKTVSARIMFYRKFPAWNRAASIWARLAEWVYKPWLLFGKCFPNGRMGGLYMKYSICLSIFIYKPWLVNEAGLNLKVAYPTNFFPVKNKPRSNISCTASYRGLTVSSNR